MARAHLLILSSLIAHAVAAPAVSSGCAFNPEVVHVDADATRPGHACLHVCPGYVAPLPPSGIVHIDADADMAGDGCEQLEDFDDKMWSVTELAADGGVADQQSCEDAFPYPGGVNLQGHGPFTSCSDLADHCDWPHCPGIRSRIQNVWCPHTCGTCSGGGHGSGMASNPIVPTPGEHSSDRTTSTNDEKS